MIEHPIVIIHQRGDLEVVELKHGPAALQQMQSAIGGYIERIMGGPFEMWGDEEGTVKEKPVNAVASFLLRCTGSPHGFVVGDIVLTGPGDTEVTCIDLDTLENIMHCIGRPDMLEAATS